MSVADLLNEWFESELLKGTLAAPAINYLSLGPQEINSTAFNFLYNWSNSNTNLFRPGGVIKGGIGMLTQAIASSAESLGATILTGVEVSRITVQDGRATGVSLTNGKTISAKTIVSATDPRTTFTKLADPYFLGAKINKHVQNIKYRGTMGRVHFALDKLPAFSGVNQNPEKHLSGHIQISPSIEYLQKAYDPSKYGQFSKQPFLDIKIPSIVDSSLAPPGKHAMSVTVKFMPFTLKEGTWNEHRVTLGKLVINTLNSFTEDFEECIGEYRVITPLDMESIYGLPEGHPSHGEMTLNQFMWMRPIPGYAQYRSPVDGLYLCSAATHPGGGVTGINGRNASRKILNDMG